MRICCDRKLRGLLCLLFLLTFSRMPAQQAPPPDAGQLVQQMETAESAARDERQLFMYRSKEKSVRTGGHLWDEWVVETVDGRIRRLLAVDGKPLTGSALAAEQNRINNLLKHPEEYRREGQALKEDEARLRSLLQQVPKLYVFKLDGVEG